MKRVYSLLVIIMVIFLFSSCESKAVNQKEYYGEWTAGEKIYFMPISAMGEDDYKQQYLGKVAAFSEKKASFGDESKENPIYSESSITKEVFIETYRMNPEDMGLAAGETKIIHIENWNNPGSTLIVKDKDTLITLWDGVFFELNRK